MASHHIFKVLFVNQGKVYEVYARKVSHGSMLGFVEIEELVFGERAGVLLDPTEERIKIGVREREAQLSCPCIRCCASTKSASAAPARSRQYEGNVRSSPPPCSRPAR